jgi:hypothetical protein
MLPSLKALLKAIFLSLALAVAALPACSKDDDRRVAAKSGRVKATKGKHRFAKTKGKRYSKAGRSGKRFVKKGKKSKKGSKRHAGKGKRRAQQKRA